MKKAGQQNRSRLNFARCLSSLKTSYCNRNRHTHICNNLVCTKTTLFLKICSMCLCAIFRRKTKLGTTNGFSSVVIYCAWTSLMLLVQIFTARGPAHMRSTPRSLEGPKNQNTGQQKRLPILTHFLIFLFTFNFKQVSQSTFLIFLNTTMGFFMFTRDLNCSPQKPFLSVFLLDALSI
jgi:hypothetical protein